MVWVWLLGCAGTDPALIARVEALEEEVKSLRAEGVASAEPDASTTEDREERLKKLTERLKERQAKQTGPSTVRQAFEDPETMARLGRALLHKDEHGNFDGYRLSAIRRGGLADRVGVKNGDIIHRVAGKDMSSMEGTMEAFAAAQKLDVVPVELTRRGVEMTLQIPMD